MRESQSAIFCNIDPHIQMYHRVTNCSKWHLVVFTVALAKHSFTHLFFFSFWQSYTCNDCICSSEAVCAEQRSCSSRTPLMAHWKPIISKIELNELLLMCSAARWFRTELDYSDWASLLPACNTFISLSAACCDICADHYTSSCLLVFVSVG